MFFKNLIAKLKCNRGEVTSGDPAAAGQSGAKDASIQGQQGDKIDGLISDVDLSDVPENVREDVKKYLGQKVKLYDQGYRAKTEDFSKERKQFEVQKKELAELVTLRDEIQGDPALEKEVTNLINRKRAGLSFNTSSSDKKDKINHLDGLISEAPDAETKESLRQLKAIIKEETSTYGEYQNEIQAMREEIKTLKSATLSGQAERIDTKIQSLCKEFGDEVVKDVEMDLRKSALRYPNASVKKLFISLIDEDKLETVILEKAKRKQQQEDKIKTQGSSPGGQGVKTPVEVKKDKFGRVNIGQWAKDALARKA
jgi:hypothetical protein